MRWFILLLFLHGCATTPNETPNIMGGLDLYVRPQLPKEITTVGEAVDYYLEPSTYALVKESVGLSRPLADKPTESTPVTIREAISRVIGGDYQLQVQKDVRMISIAKKRQEQPHEVDLSGNHFGTF